MLYYPWREVEDLKIINGILTDLFTAAYRLYRALYRHLEDGLSDLAPVTDNIEHSDSNNNFKSQQIETKFHQNATELLMGRRNNQDATRIKDPDELNKRNIDRAYD